MPGVRVSSRAANLKASLASHNWTVIGGVEWEQLRRELPAVAETSLRRLLWDEGVEIRQPWCGVRTKSFEELERSLLDLEHVYTGSLETRGTCRKLVIQAKDRTRFASRNLKVDADTRAIKEEMVRWMLVWLDDPAMFEPWVRRRKELSAICGCG